jgi:hypothetical protein
MTWHSPHKRRRSGAPHPAEYGKRVGIARPPAKLCRELWHKSRIELCELANRITSDLREFPEGSPERANALVSLRNIRYVLLARRDFSP